MKRFPENFLPPSPRDISESGAGQQFSGVDGIQTVVTQLTPKPQDVAVAGAEFASSQVTNKFETVAILATPPLIIVSTVILAVAIVGGGAAAGSSQGQKK